MKTCLITGGNSGIGKQAAIQIAKVGYQVIIGCRNIERGEKALIDIKKESGNSNVDMLLIDMSSKKSIEDALKQVIEKYNYIDVLIHNAADFDISRKKRVLSDDGIEKVWATNHIGPVMLTNGLMELLQKSEQGRIITIASQGLVMYPGLKVNLDDPEFVHRPYSVAKAYYQSKLAQVMYTYWLAGELKDKDITVNCIRVTNVKVDISRYPELSKVSRFMYKLKSKMSISANEMAKTYTWLATSSNLADITGKYFNEKNKEVQSSAYSMDSGNIKQIIDLTRKYTEV